MKGAAPSLKPDCSPSATVAALLTIVSEKLHALYRSPVASRKSTAPRTIVAFAEGSTWTGSRLKANLSVEGNAGGSARGVRSATSSGCPSVSAFVFRSGQSGGETAAPPFSARLPALVANVDQLPGSGPSSKSAQKKSDGAPASSDAQNVPVAGGSASPVSGARAPSGRAGERERRARRRAPPPSRGRRSRLRRAASRCSGGAPRVACGRAARDGAEVEARSDEDRGEAGRGDGERRAAPASLCRS